MATESSKQSKLPKLTGKQLRWVDAYCGEARFNATEAARLAGYTGKPARIRQVGSENRANANIRAHVDAWLNEHSLRAPEVIERLTDVANAEWDEFTDKQYDGETGQLTRERRDVMPQLKALELLGRHHRLFTDNVALSGGIRREVVIRDAADPSSPVTEVSQDDDERRDS